MTSRDVLDHDLYSIVSHDAIGELATQVYDLASLAFGSYAGVLKPSPAHRAWYVHRPGMDGALSQAALHRGQLVASVFVTVAEMRLGGRLQPVGIVDTVMTHPAHRRRGLARRLLSQAIGAMQARALAASLLYTVPHSMPYRFYQTLGYRPHAPVHCFARLQQAMTQAVRPARAAGAADGAQLMEFLNGHFCQHDGYVPMDEGLWRWRKVDRPDELPADTYLVREGGRLLGCVTACRARIVGARHGSVSYVLSDLAIARQADAQSVLASLLSAVPPGAEALTLSACASDDSNQMLRRAGFVEQGSEVGMLLPLGPRAENDAATPPKCWYVLAESVIGV